MDPLDAIADVHRAQVREALACALDAPTVSAAQPVRGGASGAATYRVDASGRPLLVRVEEPTRNALRDPARSFVCMRIAAEAGVAPALHHADCATGIAIMDFVPVVPLSQHPDGAAGVARGMGELLERLHAAPLFPPLADYLEMTSRLLDWIDQSGLIAHGLLDPHRDTFATILGAYPRQHAPKVSSHNDAHARNLLYDGTRLWLVDWELSFRNDPIVDVAVAADSLASTPELEATLLQARFGKVDRGDRARLAVMRPCTQLFYAVILLGGFAASPGAEPDCDLSAPTPAQLEAEVAAGRLALGERAFLYQLAKMFLAGFLERTRQPEFARALADARA